MLTFLLITRPLIAYYYRPKSGTINYSMPLDETDSENSISIRSSIAQQSYFSSDFVNDSHFTQSELNQIVVLKNIIPTHVISDFNSFFYEWQKTWNRPEIGIHSNSIRYTESDEYYRLLSFSTKYGNAVLPLIFEKLSEGVFFISHLLETLTLPDNQHTFDFVMSTRSEVEKLVVKLHQRYLCLISNMQIYYSKIKNMRTKLFSSFMICFSLLFFSCNSNNDRLTSDDNVASTYSSSSDEPAPGAHELPAKPDLGDDPYENMTDQTPEEYTVSSLIITGDDIVSFNTTDGSIVFTDLIHKKLTTLVDAYYYNFLSVYCNGKLLFDSIPRRNGSSSVSYNDLVLLQDFSGSAIGFRFADGYPEVIFLAERLPL